MAVRAWECVAFIWSHPIIFCLFLLSFTPALFPVIVYFSPLLISTALCAIALISMNMGESSETEEESGNLQSARRWQEEQVELDQSKPARAGLLERMRKLEEKARGWMNVLSFTQRKRQADEIKWNVIRDEDDDELPPLSLSGPPTKIKFGEVLEDNGTVTAVDDAPGDTRRPLIARGLFISLTSGDEGKKIQSAAANVVEMHHESRNVSPPTVEDKSSVSGVRKAAEGKVIPELVSSEPGVKSDKSASTVGTVFSAIASNREANLGAPNEVIASSGSACKSVEVNSGPPETPTVASERGGLQVLVKESKSEPLSAPIELVLPVPTNKAVATATLSSNDQVATVENVAEVLSNSVAQCLPIPMEKNVAVARMMKPEPNGFNGVKMLVSKGWESGPSVLGAEQGNSGVGRGENSATLVDESAQSAHRSSNGRHRRDGVAVALGAGVIHIDAAKEVNTVKNKFFSVMRAHGYKKFTSRLLETEKDIFIDERSKLASTSCSLTEESEVKGFRNECLKESDHQACVEPVSSSEQPRKDGNNSLGSGSVEEQENLPVSNEFPKKGCLEEVLGVVCHSNVEQISNLGYASFNSRSVEVQMDVSGIKKLEVDVAEECFEILPEERNDASAARMLEEDMGRQVSEALTEGSTSFTSSCSGEQRHVPSTKKFVEELMEETFELVPENDASRSDFSSELRGTRSSSHHILAEEDVAQDEMFERSFSGEESVVGVLDCNTSSSSIVTNYTPNWTKIEEKEDKVTVISAVLLTPASGPKFSEHEKSVPSTVKLTSIRSVRMEGEVDMSETKKLGEEVMAKGSFDEVSWTNMTSIADVVATPEIVVSDAIAPDSGSDAEERVASGVDAPPLVSATIICDSQSAGDEVAAVPKSGQSTAVLCGVTNTSTNGSDAQVSPGEGPVFAGARGSITDLSGVETRLSLGAKGRVKSKEEYDDFTERYFTRKRSASLTPASQQNEKVEVAEARSVSLRKHASSRESSAHTDDDSLSSDSEDEPAVSVRRKAWPGIQSVETAEGITGPLAKKYTPTWTKVGQKEDGSTERAAPVAASVNAVDLTERETSVPEDSLMSPMRKAIDPEKNEESTERYMSPMRKVMSAVRNVGNKESSGKNGLPPTPDRKGASSVLSKRDRFISPLKKVFTSEGDAGKKLDSVSEVQPSPNEEGLSTVAATDKEDETVENLKDRVQLMSPLKRAFSTEANGAKKADVVGPKSRGLEKSPSSGSQSTPVKDNLSADRFRERFFLPLKKAFSVEGGGGKKVMAASKTPVLTPEKKGSVAASLAGIEKASLETDGVYTNERFKSPEKKFSLSWTKKRVKADAVSSSAQLREGEVSLSDGNSEANEKSARRFISHGKSFSTSEAMNTVDEDAYSTDEFLSPERRFFWPSSNAELRSEPKDKQRATPEKSASSWWSRRREKGGVEVTSEHPTAKNGDITPDVSNGYGNAESVDWNTTPDRNCSSPWLKTTPWLKRREREERERERESLAVRRSPSEEKVLSPSPRTHRREHSDSLPTRFTSHPERRLSLSELSTPEKGPTSADRLSMNYLDKSLSMPKALQSQDRNSEVMDLRAAATLYKSRSSVRVDQRKERIRNESLSFSGSGSDLYRTLDSPSNAEIRITDKLEVPLEEVLSLLAVGTSERPSNAAAAQESSSSEETSSSEEEWSSSSDEEEGDVCSAPEVTLPAQSRKPHQFFNKGNRQLRNVDA